MDMPDLEQLLGVKAVFVKAGLAGSIVGAVVQKVADWREAIARGIAGVCCAAYLTPMPVRFFNVTDTADIGAIAFCVGMGGMGLAAWIIVQMKDPWRMIRAWLNKTVPPEQPSGPDKPGEPQ